jgi:hemolysin D
MTATTPVAYRKSERRVARRFTDHEFLPAALEILERPPSPVGTALILIICAFFAAALAWAYIGRIDIIAVAQGKLQPAGRTKIVQPLETGKVLTIRAKNGDHVKQGDVLVALDPAESAADEAAYAADLASYRAEVLRRRAAITAAESAASMDRAGQSPDAQLAESRSAIDPPPISWPADIPDAVRLREERVLSSDLLELNSQVESLLAQAKQKRAEKERLAKTIQEQNKLLITLQERVAMRQELLDLKVGSKSNLYDALESLQYQNTMLAQQTGQLAEADANLGVLAKDIKKSYETFIADNAQKLADADRQVGDLAEKLAKARARTNNLLLRSPIDGVVQASSVVTIGQVVSSGEEIMRIVPEDAPLEIECYLPNKDVGFVKDGQEAVIKVESFPFTRYGTIRARVIRVARDAIPEPDATQSEANPGKSIKSVAEAGAERTQNLVFPVVLRPEQPDIDVDGAKIPLSPGMAVTAEINTGHRRILEYIFSPLVQIGSEALHER